MPVQPLRDIYPNQAKFIVLVDGKEPRKGDRIGKNSRWPYDLRRRTTTVELEYAIKSEIEGESYKPAIARIHVLDPEYFLIENDFRRHQFTVLIGYMSEFPLLEITGYPVTSLSNFPEETDVEHVISIAGGFGFEHQLTEKTLIEYDKDYIFYQIGELPVPQRGEAWEDYQEYFGPAKVTESTPLGVGTPIGYMSIDKFIQELNKANEVQVQSPSKPDEHLAQYCDALDKAGNPDFENILPDFYDRPISELRPGQAPKIPLRKGETDWNYLDRLIDYLNKMRMAAVESAEYADTKKHLDWASEWTLDHDKEFIYFAQKKDIPWYREATVIPVFGYHAANHACLSARVYYQSSVKKITTGTLSMLTADIGQTESVEQPGAMPPELEEFSAANIEKLLSGEGSAATTVRKQQILKAWYKGFRLVDIGPDGRVYIPEQHDFWKTLATDLAIEAKLVGFPLKAGCLIGIVGLPAAVPEEAGGEGISAKLPFSRVYRLKKVTHTLGSEGFWITNVTGTGASGDLTDEYIDQLAKLRKRNVAIKDGKLTIDIENWLRDRTLGIEPGKVY